MKFLATATVCLVTLQGLFSQVNEDRLAVARTAIQEWLGARDRSDKLLNRTVDRILAAERPGLRLLATTSSATDERDTKRIRVVHSLVRHVGLRWLDRVEASRMVFAGQYDPLRVLLPDIGEFYLELLVDTPAWYPDNRRWRVIPAVRDLYPKGPDKEMRGQIETMALDVDREPEYLRVSLSYALAQWGNRKLIKAKIASLQKTADAKDEESSLLAHRDLAAIYYGIRDYPVAAVMHRNFIRRAEAADYYIVPVDYYNAACCMCLSGDRRSAMDFLKRCLDLNQSDKVDTSMRLERDLFEKDPEIALIRSASGFVEMLTRAFGAKRGPQEEKQQKKKKKKR